MAEFSDQRLPDLPKADQFYGFFPAKYISQYLESYVDSHIYADNPLASRIRTNSLVTKLEKNRNDGQWHAHVCEQAGMYQSGLRARTYIVTAPRIIDATGLTSCPSIPLIPGLDTFVGEKIHQKGFAKSDLLIDDKKCHIIVVGGAKSAADLAYASAKAEKRVSWVIRKSGHGPASLAPAKGSGPYENSNESFYTRLTALFLASLFTPASDQNWSWARFMESMLHRTTVGLYIFSWLWKGITARAWKEAGYARRQARHEPGRSSDNGKRKGRGFSNLQPDTSLFWQNDSSGINQRPDFFSTIANKVDVYREDIECVSGRKVRLADQNRTCLPADVIIFATGWDTQSSFSHFDEATSSRLGLPVLKCSQHQEDAAGWADLDYRAESRILHRFPILAHPPPHHNTPSTLSPFRLYKGMLPISDHSIVFLGKIMLGNHFRAAEVQALWALAVFDGTLNLPSEEVMRTSIAETVAWCKRRYLSKGQLGNWFWFDMVPYTDLLLQQLGLRSHRKRRGWFGLGDLWAPCFAEDLRGLIVEYENRCSKGRNKCFDS